MVTKPCVHDAVLELSFILAKNHMVTKLKSLKYNSLWCFILAKNHMVTKLK